MTGLDEFFEEIKQVAAALFRAKGEHIPLFYMQLAGVKGPVITSAQWDDSANKAYKFMLVRTGIELGAVERCCLVHEMWYAQYKTPASGVIDIDNTPLPSERPDRMEMLMIVGVDRDAHRIGHWEIKRPGTKKRPHLGEFQNIDDFTSISNAFRGLLKTDGIPQ